MNDATQQPAAPTATTPKRWRPRWADLPPDGQPGWREGLGNDFFEQIEKSVQRELSRNANPLQVLFNLLPALLPLAIFAGPWIPGIRVITDWVFDSVWLVIAAATGVVVLEFVLLRRNSRRGARIAAARKAIARETGRYPVCLKCDYDVRHAPDTCPECGQPVVGVRFGDE